MDRTTNLLVFLIVISFIFPATAIRYAQAANTTPSESMENNTTSTGAVDATPSANITQNNANMTGESTENNATAPANMTENTGPITPTPMENTTSPSGSAASNNTGNATSTGVPENATSPNESTVNNSTANNTGK